jgi:hypothetical protein
MACLYVGVNQGAVMPKNCAAYDGITTAGIDSCTGVALSSTSHIFLAHFPPCEDETPWKQSFNAVITAAIAKLGGAFEAGWVASPNFGDHYTPHFGPAYAYEYLVDECWDAFGIPEVAKNHLTLLKTGQIEVNGTSHNTTQGNILVTFPGDVKLNTYGEMKLLTLIN